MPGQWGSCESVSRFGTPAMNSVAIFGTLLLCSFLKFQTANAANPLKNPSICGRPSCVPGDKFKYQQDIRYDYQYSVNVNTLFRGTSSNQSSFHINVNLSLEFLSPCEGVLTVSQVSLLERAPEYDRIEDKDVSSPSLPNSEAFHRDITQYPLRFSFHDGVIGEVCANENEATWVLNFKKGILSTFQNTMKRFDVHHETIESDIHGDCQTTYKLEGAREISLALIKTKDIATCTNRYKHHSVLQMTPYVFPADFKSTPVVRSTSTCEIIVNHNIYIKVTCNEDHLFQPFSSADSGAVTTTQQMLTLLSESSGSWSDELLPITKRSSLLFDHNMTAKPASGELKASRDLIKTMCKLNTDDVQLQYPDVFTKFIQTARILSYPALTQIVHRAGSNCVGGKKHVYDALPIIGSNAAIMVMKDIILKKGVSMATIHEWLMTLAFIPRPDLATIGIIAPLLHHENADAQFMLSISSVVHTYCKYSAQNCAQQKEVLSIVEFVENKFIHGCQQWHGDRVTQEETQVALKAIGNMGIHTSRITSSLQKCLTNGNLTMTIRLAALEAFRRLPCEQFQNYFLKYYRDQTVDTELRIAAYLNVMKCPNYLTIQTIQHILQEEEVNQVGSFVWSHLKNLLSTSIPSRLEIQGLLQDKDLVRKFSSDIRKFSQNYEGSLFLDEYNIGGNYESNVIFSPKSYLPRSAMLNLTVDLFGESINVFEVAGRIEGFEHYVEAFFGPTGPYSANKVRDVISKFRSRRSVPDNLHEKVDELPNVIDNNFSHPKATMGLKIFGNELNFKSLDSHQEIMGALNAINPYQRLLQLLSGKEVNINKAALFMDTSYVIPTGAGLPITLSAIGTAAINLKIAGKLNADNFVQIKSLDLVGKLRPSVAMDVVGTMGVDAYYGSTGIKLKTNLYSSAAIEGEMKIRGSRLVSVIFSLPKDKTEIINARSQLVVMNSNKEEFQSGITDNRIEQHICSWDSLDRTLGLKLCMDFKFPNATLELNASQSILNGPTSFEVSLNKADPSAKQYLLEYKWDTTESATFISLMFDTPGSNLKRELSAKLNLDRKNLNLTLDLRSADTHLVAHGTYKNEPEEKYINFGLELNGKRHLDTQIGLKSRKNKYGFTHFPRLYIAINNERIAELSGNLKWVDKNEVAQCDVNLEFHTKKLETKLFGYVVKNNASISLDVKLDYKFDDGKLENVHIEAGLSQHTANSVSKAEGKFNLESSAYPHFNFDSSIKFQKAQGHLDCKLEVNTTPHKADDRYKLTMQYVFKYYSNQDGKKLSTFLEITKPISDIDLRFDLAVSVKGSTKDLSANVRYATGKMISVKVNVVMPTHGVVFDGKLNITVPGFTPMLVALRLNEKLANEYDVTFSATWFSGHSITGKGVYQDKSSHKATYHNLKLAIKSPSFDEFTLNCKFIKDNIEIKIDIQAENLDNKYALLVKHVAPSSTEIENYLEVKYKNRVYSLTTSVNLENTRQVLLELHLDQFRDIHLALKGINKKGKKEAGIEIKWDANRDPGQKFAVSLMFNHPGYMNYSAGFMVSFPGRTIKGHAEMDLKGTNIASALHLEWSPQDAIDVKLLTFYNNAKTLIFKINSEVLSPFENWKRTSLTGGLRREGNLVQANGSVYWQDDQHIAIDMFGDYFISNPEHRCDLRCELRCEFNASVVSTIPQVSTMSGSFFHKQNHHKYITRILLENKPPERISVNSEWTLEDGEEWTNLTGIVLLVSPFEGYKKGDLITQFHINQENDIRGVADLELEKKKYTLSMKGQFKQVTNSVMEFNITTPIEKYHTITGRFGYSEPKKHFIAKLRGPTGSIGVEIIFSILSSSEFDVKFHVATPIDFLQRVLLVAKLNPNAADFRCGWNNLTLGFTGVWHFESTTDFEYSYLIFTPLEGFEKHGVIAKLIHKEKMALDFETSLKLADIMLGLQVKGEPKPHVLTGVHLPKKEYSPEDGSEEEESDIDEEIEEINWRGMLVLDTYIYNTIKGTLDVDQKDTSYIVESTLILPNGTAEFYNEFNMEDVLTMSNQLRLSTPFDAFSALTSNYIFEVMPGEKYIISMDANYVSRSSWVNSGVLLNYTYEDNEEEEIKIHLAKFNIVTPFELLPKLNTQIVFEIEENLYRANFTMFTNSGRTTAATNLELDSDFLEASFGLGMVTPLYNVPQFKITARRDFTAPEKKMELSLERIFPGHVIYSIEGSWHYEKNTLLKMKINMRTPFEILPSIGGNIHYTRNVKEQSYSFDSQLNYAAKLEVKVKCLLQSDEISIMLETPLEKFKNIVFNGTIKGSDNSHRSIISTVTYDDKSFSITGEFQMTDEVPLAVKLSTPYQDGKAIAVFINISKQTDGFLLDAKLEIGQDHLKVTSDVTMKPNYNCEMSVKITSTHAKYSSLIFNGKYLKQSDGNLTLELNTDTSIQGMERIHFMGNTLMTKQNGKVKTAFDVTKARGDLHVEWIYIVMENMGAKVIGSYTVAEQNKHISTELFYRNPKRALKHLAIGVDANYNRNEWQFGANGTLDLPTADDISILLNLKIPPPNHDIHTILGKFQYSSGYVHVLQVLKYFTTFYKESNFGTSGELNMSKEFIKANLQLEWGNENLQVINNMLDVKRKDEQIDLVYKLKTPKYEDETLVANVFYDNVDGHRNAKGDVFCPANRFISGGEIDFESLMNMNGTVNTTTPFPVVAYLGVHFATVAQALFNQRFVELFWPNNTALLNSTYTYDSKNLNTQLDGSVVVEVPLATRHVGKITYGYKEVPLNKTGYSFVEYNKRRFLEGKYNCVSVESAGLDKDTINIEIENDYHPLGVLYIHQYEYSGGSDGLNLPTTDTKKAEIFKLHNRNAFHLSGEMAVRTTFTGQEILLTAIHSNRTVKLKTDYDFLDHQFNSKSLLQLDPNAWASYDLTIINKTTSEKDEDHIELNFAYPKRNFTVNGYYQLANSSLSSEMTFVWDKLAKTRKSVGASLDWKQISNVPNKQHAVISLKHPSFIRDVTLNTHFYRDSKDLFDLNADLVYSADDKQKFAFSTKVQDNSGGNFSHYSIAILGSHPATRLDLNVNGELKWTPSVYKAYSDAKYKRSFLPYQYGHAKAILDTLANEIDMEKQSPKLLTYLRAKYTGTYPKYLFNGSYARGEEKNFTGKFFLNIHEQILTANVNLTPDASQSLHTYGRIPDSRNAVFNVWRVYEDLVVSDVAFYWRLNHSRLVTSKLIWRPEIEDEVKTGFQDLIDAITEEFYVTISYWKNYIKSESVDAIDGIWSDAKPVVIDFLNDIKELKTLENDMEEFKNFLNTSYNANEFYIRDIVNVTSYLLDELAIRGHIETFPAILNEVWAIMGDSGKAIQASLIWIIDKIKNSYKNAKELLNSILRGDSMDHISAMFERLVEKYDKFIKDLHVSFIKHIEHLWLTFTELVKSNWNKTLLAVEPTFIAFAHYVETIVWNLSNDVLDFLYERQNDIQRSPYFTKFTNFTQDIDRLYKDIKKNDALTNIKKYSQIVFEFIKERYFTIVPFGKELQNIVSEIIGEFKQLLKLPSINFVLTRANELVAKVEYLYTYFDVAGKTQRIIQFIHLKITDITQTALQAEDRYREAKTKFVFDPENGRVELEQKLPMSWHAFNETPKFEEIREYKAINDIQNYFIASNTTFWTLYYQYKPYTEPTNWLPPFSAQAIMAGPQHFGTFDKRYFEYRGHCSYLLAHDFVDHNFSLSVEYNHENKNYAYEIALVIDGHTVIVDIFKDTLRLLNSDSNYLPIQFGNTFIYQEAKIIMIENSRGFTMQCNFKYDVCTYTLSGWYYGKTAGLLGTMDNEPSSDWLTSTNEVSQDLDRFAHSWALEPEKCSSNKNYALEMEKSDLQLVEKCELFYRSKLSPFSHCFAVVDSTPFMSMCVNSRLSDEQEECTSAIAYMQACLVENTPLRIPDSCVTCESVNGTHIPEGYFIDLQDHLVPQSTDVVFIVEAKECNRNIKGKRNIDILVASLAKELSDINIRLNRYALVTFGGDGVFDKPRSIAIDNNVFTIHQTIPQYFDNIRTGNGKGDIFGAIGFASKLIFRPGVSKTFILLPCTNCDHSNMTLDYTVMHQVLVENDITLHIIMNDDFIFEKSREGKTFYGMDGGTAYTKKDVRLLKGDVALRRQVKLPKSMLGYCTPLALETNGTVFTAKKLESDGKKVNAVKKFASVFSKRVANTARPVGCQVCECTADNNGMSYMECFPCEFPSPANIDYGFNDDQYVGTFDQSDLDSFSEEESS